MICMWLMVWCRILLRYFRYKIMLFMSSRFTVYTHTLIFMSWLANSLRATSVTCYTYLSDVKYILDMYTLRSQAYQIWDHTTVEAIYQLKYQDRFMNRVIRDILFGQLIIAMSSSLCFDSIKASSFGCMSAVSKHHRSAVWVLYQSRAVVTSFITYRGIPSKCRSRKWEQSTSGLFVFSWKGAPR